jgi:hypothetical protein
MKATYHRIESRGGGKTRYLASLNDVITMTRRGASRNPTTNRQKAEKIHSDPTALRRETG